MEVDVPLLFGGLGAAAVLVAVLLCALVRRRRPTHVPVNCWFCNQNTVVPYGNRNCWDCPNCEQYNGFQENGDYNKPIPAQHSEHLNHVLYGGNSESDAKPQQWVNSQMLLCKKCNNNQSTKIKLLASFSPREEDQYDEEIEVFKHHLEQMYKLCRPCQAAVDYYVKHQNRQLRALMLNHQLKRREMDKTFVQSCFTSSRAPMHVIAFRFLAFLSCAFLLSWALLDFKDVSLGEQTPTARSSPDRAKNSSFWEEILFMVPEPTLETLNIAWRFGLAHQTEVVFIGFLMCIFAILLGGRVRLRRVDVFASFLWMLVAGLYLSEEYLLAESPSWLDTAKLGTTSLCCLVGFTAAVATHKATGQRRHRPRRYTSGDPTFLFRSLTSGCAAPEVPTPQLSTPPGLVHLLTQETCHRSDAFPSSLPRRLYKALSLGTLPSLTRTDSGYLFSGSRPPSVTSAYKYSPGSDYYSLLSGSSPLPSPTPSVAGSATSSNGSLYHRRPLISPPRFNLQAQRLGISNAEPNGHLARRRSFEETSHPDSTASPADVAYYVAKNQANTKVLFDSASVSSNPIHKMENCTNHSSECQVDTTTGFLDSRSTSGGRNGLKLTHGFLVVSLTVNVAFSCCCLYLLYH
ncbi:transmembrane protein 201 isoform X2 [Spea bombifrons]|uniref:transmembrane protein 201 isoform X2 n=1 Tax=Spea bombifrons TaxID=233779 RepID=UPI0023495D83|nr:transmembrane protein 201 isoform X2 [Spea bombifrons]